MKVLLVHKFWRKVGGAEVYFQDVARILRSHGHDVKIYTTDFDAEGSRDVYERNENIIFGETVEYLKGPLLSRIKNIPEVIYSKKNKSGFKKLLQEYKPAIFKGISGLDSIALIRISTPFSSESLPINRIYPLSPLDAV